MFELTQTLDDFALRSVVYHVHLRAFERHRFPGHAERLRRMRGIMREDEFPLIPVIEQIVGEIEQDAGAALEKLSDTEIRDYTRQLGEIAKARRPPVSPEITARALRTLEEIRREFGYAV